MLTHRLPYPPWTGDRVRAFHIARYLAERHHVTVACPLEGQGELKAAQRLQKLIPDLEYALLNNFTRHISALGAFLGHLPLSVRYFTSRSLACRVRQRLMQEHFDLVYVSSSQMAQYVKRCSVPIIMDFVDVDSDKWRQYATKTIPPMTWIYRLEAHRLRCYERLIAHSAAVSVFVTSIEQKIFREIVPDVRTVVIPNGVDTEYFRPGESPRSKVPTIVFTGALDYFPNIEGLCYFSEKIFPLVQRRIPEVRFLIVGRRPGRTVLRLDRLPGIAVTGNVPDVRPYMNEAHVAVVPLRIARGIQNKILEAMAMGLSVVSSPQPSQGISARTGVEWFVESRPEAFAERIVCLLHNSAMCAEVGHRARAFVENRYSWKRILPDVETLVESIAV